MSPAAATNGGASAGPLTLPRLEFEIRRAEAKRHTAAPVIGLELAVNDADGRGVRSVLLDAQVRIAARRRRYREDEKERLTDLFGPEKQWSSSLAALLWQNMTVTVANFSAGEATVELPLQCSYDFEVSANRYLASLEHGEIPLEVMFSGTVFYGAGPGAAQLGRIPLDQDATFALPVETWREAMNHHFPDSAWLRISRRAFRRLHGYRSRHGLGSWDEVVDSLLDQRGGAR